jgi:DNA-directed RNA polymerase specialized sigma24 family protein
MTPVAVVVDVGAGVAAVAVAAAESEMRVGDFVGLVVDGHDTGDLVQEILLSLYGSLAVEKYC